MKTTEEGNKLIAEFMGLIETEPGYLYNDQFEKAFLKDYLGYNSSWDWLMPVVEKIDSILPDDQYVSINYNNCTIDIYSFPPFVFNSLTITGEGISKIHATWNCVCEFITWYNEQ